MLHPLKKAYVSEIDDFLNQFNQSHAEKSASQQKEIAKNARIAQLRDGITSPTTSSAATKEIWNKF